MGNRSRYVAAAAAAVGGGVLLARRRERLRRAAEEIGDTILPTHDTEPTVHGSPIADEAHAPGHRHLSIDEVEDSNPRHLRGRPEIEPPPEVEPRART